MCSHARVRACMHKHMHTQTSCVINFWLTLLVSHSLAVVLMYTCTYLCSWDTISQVFDVYLSDPVLVISLFMTMSDTDPVTC